MGNELETIHRTGAEAVRQYLMPVVTALGLAAALVWAPSEPVATAPAPFPRAEARPDAVCLFSPVAKRPCEAPRRTVSLVPLGPVKAVAPAPPRHWLVAAATARPAAPDGPPGWTGPGKLGTLAPDLRPGAFAPAAPTGPLRLAARPTVSAIPAGTGLLHVQVGAYAEGANVERAVAALRALGFGVGERAGRDGAVRAIAAGPFATEVEAAVALAALRAAGFGDAYLTR